MDFSDNNNNFLVMRKLKFKIIAAYNTEDGSFLESFEELLNDHKSIVKSDMNFDLLRTNSYTIY